MIELIVLICLNLVIFVEEDPELRWLCFVLFYQILQEIVLWPDMTYFIEAIHIFFKIANFSFVYVHFEAWQKRLKLILMRLILMSLLFNDSIAVLSKPVTLIVQAIFFFDVKNTFRLILVIIHIVLQVPLVYLVQIELPLMVAIHFILQLFKVIFKILFRVRILLWIQLQLLQTLLHDF